MHGDHNTTCILADDILDSLREALLILDTSLHVVSANLSFYNLFKVKRKDTLKRMIYELGNGQLDIPDLHRLLEGIIANQITVENFQIQHTFEQIGSRLMQINARTIPQEHGKSFLILLAIEDITDQVAILQKHVDSERKYRKFVEEINSIIIGFDREGNITFFNHFSEKLFGYSRDEVMGAPFVGTVIPYTDSTGRDNTGICKMIFSDPASFYQNESEGVRSDGSRILFSWSARAVCNATGEIIEILIDGNDITALARERQESEENSAILDALLTFIPEGIMITDANHVVRRLSRNMGELLGIPVEELLNTDKLQRLEMMQIYRPDGEKITKPDELPLSKSAISEQTIIDYEIILQNNGGRKILSVSAAPVFESQKKVIGAVGGWRDITDRKHLEEQLKNERNFVDAVLQTSGALITVIDRDGKITRFNRACEELTGYTADEVTGRTIFDFLILPEERQEVIGVAQRLFNDQIKIDHENYWITKSGEKRFIRWRNTIVHSENGERTYAVATGIDITDRRRTEDDLKFERGQLRVILDNLNVGIILLDNKGTLLIFNTTVLRWYGYKSDSEMMQHSSAYISEYDLRDSEDTVIPFEKWPAPAAVKGEYVKDLEVKLTRKRTGDFRWISFTTVPIRGLQGEVVSILMSMVDISERKNTDQLLRKALEKAEAGDRLLSALMENIPEGISISGPEGTIHTISKHGQDLLGGVTPGMSIEEAASGWTVFRPDGHTLMPTNELPLVRALAGERVRDIELVQVNSAGHKIPLLCNAAPIRNAKGNVVNGIVVWRDITTLKKAQTALQESESRYRGIFHNAALGIFQVDSSDRFIAVNKYVCQLLGYKEKELLAMDVHQLTVPEDRAISDKENEKIHRKKVSMVTYEKRYLKADGSKLWVNVTVSSIRDEKDRHTGSVTIVEDISERKKMESALRESQERFSAAFRSVQDALVISDVNTGTISDVNETWVSHWGYSIKETIGRPSTELGIYTNKADRERALQILHKEGRLADFEVVLRTRSGEIRNAVLFIELLKLSQKSLMLTIIHDITERKAAEEALHHNRQMLAEGEALSHTGAWEWNILADKWSFSDEWLLIHGISRQILSTDMLMTLAHPDDRQILNDAMQKLKTGTGTYDMEHRIIRQNDGAVRIVHSRGKFIRDTNGRVVRVYGFAQDITERTQVKNALLESERRFRQVVESLPQLVWTSTPDGSCDFLSPQWVQYTGKNVSEQLGYRWLEQLHPDDRQRTAHQWQQTFAKGENFSIEFRIRRYDGEYRWFQTMAVPLHDNTGRIIKWFGSNTDIHDSKLSQEELRRNESILTTIIDALPVGIITADARGRLTRINPATRELWGIPPKTESWEQYSNWIGWWPQTGERIKAEQWALARALRNGEIIRNELVRNEKFGTHEQRYYLANAVPLRDGEGRITGGVVAMLDVTDRFAIEQELRESEAGLKRAQEIAHLGSWELDLINNRLTWSDEVYRIFGLKPQEFKATYEKFLERIHPEDRAAVDDAYRESVREGYDSYEIEHRVVRKYSGEIRFVHEKCQHVRDSKGGIIRSLGMVQDITYRKQAEEQIRQKVELLEKANSELERFNRIAVGREIRMIELKREINGMCVRLGEPPRYSLKFIDEEQK